MRRSGIGGSLGGRRLGVKKVGRVGGRGPAGGPIARCRAQSQCSTRTLPVEYAVTNRAELESTICIGFVEHVLWLLAFGGGLDGGGRRCQAAYFDF